MGLYQAALRDGFTRVKAVVLEIGQLATVEPDSMAFCFDIVTRGSIAEGAQLEMIMVPGNAWCMDCEKNVAIACRDAQCPQCAGYHLQITSGTDMRVKSLSVEN